MKKTKPKSRQGFSIVEVMITLFIIGTVLVLYQAAAGTIRFVRVANHQEIALAIANNKIETLRSGGFGNLPESGSFSDPQLGSLPDGTAALDISSLNDDTKEVSVSVEWREFESMPAKSVSLDTLITKTGGL